MMENKLQLTNKMTSHLILCIILASAMLTCLYFVNSANKHSSYGASSLSPYPLTGPAQIPKKVTFKTPLVSKAVYFEDSFQVLPSY